MTSPQGPRILVVDDDRDTLEVECALLQREGFRLVCVESVEAAVTAEPALEGIPTLMVTAHAHPELRERALQEGFDAVLAKPVDPRRLIEMVEQLIAP